MVSIEAQNLTVRKNRSLEALYFEQKPLTSTQESLKCVAKGLLSEFLVGIGNSLAYETSVRLCFRVFLDFFGRSANYAYGWTSCGTDVFGTVYIRLLEYRDSKSASLFGWCDRIL